MANLRVKVDPSGAVSGAAKAENAIERIETQAYRTEAATNHLGAGLLNVGGKAQGASTQLAVATQRSSALGFQVQNASYQIGDFAVQVASGTSAVRAMTQQLPQLLGGFGVFGAVLGAAAAIGGALIPVLFDIGDEADSLADHIKNVNEELEDLAAKRDMIIYGAESRSEGRIKREMDELGREIAALEDKRREMKANARARIGPSIKISEAQLEKLVTAEIRSQTKAINEQIGIKKEKIALLKLERDEERLMSSAEEERAGWSSALLQETIRVNVEFAREAAEERAGYEASWEWWAVDEFKRAQEAKRAELIAAQKDMTEYVKAGAIERAGWEAAFSGAGADMTLGPDYKPPKARGGGRSAAETLADQYDRLRGSLDEVYKATKDYEDAQELLGKALAAGQITQGQYNETLAMARQRMNEAVNGATGLADVFDNMEGAFADAFVSMVDGTKSASDAFKDMARTIIGELYDVLVVQRLVGSFDQSAGTGSGIVGMLGKALTGSRADGGSVRTGEPYLVGERGPELFVPHNSGKISPSGAGSSAPVVNMSFSFQGGLTAADLGNALPKVVESAKRAVVETIQRGGAQARVFR